MVVAEGEKVIWAALASGLEIRELFVAEGSDPTLEDAASRAGAIVHRLAGGVLERVASTVTPQSEIALIAAPSATVDDLAGADLVLVGVAIQDPGNAGTMVRTAHAVGASGILFSEGSVDAFNPKTVRSSAGAVFSLPVVQGVPAEDAMKALGRLRLFRLGTAAGAETDLYETDLTGPTAVVLGNEAHGLPDALHEHLDATVRIPMTGPADSLNVAVAGAIVCFEAARQRRAKARNDS